MTTPAAHSYHETIEAGGCAPPVIVEQKRRVHFVTVSVDGYYGPEYVAILFDMLARNLSRTDHEIGFWCVTDRPEDLPENVNYIPADPRLRGWWVKLQLFSPDMPWAEGERIHYFDLDVAITGRLEDFIDAKGIIKDWHWAGANNSSVMSWDHGEHRGAWDHFSPELVADWDPGPIIPKAWLPSHAKNAGDMEWLMYATAQGWDPDPWDHYPAEWFPSYRSCKAWPPNGSKAVILHGRPKNHEITDGWVPDVWKIGGFTSFPEFKGANTTEDHRLANVASACKRDLPWFTGFKDENRACVIVGGAPSLNDTMADIRQRARSKKNRIVAVNNAWRKLAEHGVKADVTVICDARAENAAFVKDAPAGMRFLLASQCHPDVFDAVPDHCEVAVWHCGWGDAEALWDLLRPYEETKPIIVVPGGSTVTLRTMWLAVFSGFRTLHLYGVDGCYADSGAHHAYPQALNDGETVLEVARGNKRYRCSAWQARQAGEFEQTWHDFAHWRDFDGKPAPVSVFVHGTGLIPDIAKSLRAAEREKAA